MRPEGIIFDLDGVLCRTDRYHLAAWRTLAGRLGIALPPDAAERTRGVGRMESLDIVLGERAEDFTRGQKLALAEEKKRALPRISRASHARRRGAARAGDPDGAAPPGRKARRRLVEPQRAAYFGQAGPVGTARRRHRRRHDFPQQARPRGFPESRRRPGAPARALRRGGGRPKRHRSRPPRRLPRHSLYPSPAPPDQRRRADTYADGAADLSSPARTRGVKRRDLSRGEIRAREKPIFIISLRPRAGGGDAHALRAAVKPKL